MSCYSHGTLKAEITAQGLICPRLVLSPASHPSIHAPREDPDLGLTSPAICLRTLGFEGLGLTCSLGEGRGPADPGGCASFN